VNLSAEQRVRRYASVVTAVAIVMCSTILLVGLYGSGINLGELVRVPERFNPIQDICVRLTWVKVVGEDDRVRLCAEWIQLADSSGETHKFQKETQVVKAADGKLYFDHGQLVDDRLFVVLAFVIGVAAVGIVAIRYLVARYRVRLRACDAGPHASSS
jgi:hypothetical protein